MDLYNTELLSLCVTQCISVDSFFSVSLLSLMGGIVRKCNLLNMCTHTGTNHIKTWSGGCAGFQHASSLALFLGSIKRVVLMWKNKEVTL